MVHLSWTKIFWEKPLLLLSSSYWSFSLCTILKILTVDPELWQCTILDPKWSICPKFFLKNYYYHSHLPICLFHCAKYKKNSSSRSRVMRMCNFWAQNGPFPQMRTFFRKPANEPCFFHSCLSRSQKLNLLVKYWWVKNTEISLAENHFCL